jgi:hypothetical protein
MLGPSATSMLNAMLNSSRIAYDRNPDFGSWQESEGERIRHESRL